MSIVTGWFRMPAVFPIVSAHLKAQDEPVRVWSAACGSGEEAYSLAILLERDGIDGEVLASDADRALVRQARIGAYTTTSVTDTGDPDLSRWLVRERRHWKPVPTVRERVRFTVATLGEDEPPGGCSVVFARNVWRHLTPAQQDRAAERVASSLGSGGLLVVGGADLLDATLADSTPAALRRYFHTTSAHDAILTPRRPTG